MILKSMQLKIPLICGSIKTAKHIILAVAHILFVQAGKFKKCSTYKFDLFLTYLFFTIFTGIQRLLDIYVLRAYYPPNPMLQGELILLFICLSCAESKIYKLYRKNAFFHLNFL